MPATRKRPSAPHVARHTIRLGYVALADCAPLAVARETGIFERHGLKVRLTRDLGWASVRDRIYQGELDAAQAIAGIAFALGLGVSGLRRGVAVPMVLNLHGNAITLSNEIDPALMQRGALKRHLSGSWKKNRPFTLAATHRYSSHHILLTQWLRMQELSAPEDVEIVFLPPPLMPAHLKAGHIDGYCVGEPWNSVAIVSGTGWCPVTSAELSHGHPEKVLLVSDRFLEEHREETVRLVAALLESCALCQDAAFRPELMDILSLPHYTAAPREVLANSLGETFHAGPRTISAANFHVFHGPGVNTPSVDKASWVLSGLRSANVLPELPGIPLSRIYREELFLAAVGTP
ncbi:MAG TPA: CmpA/NrtA family ABC transporter substrate-binding protein [Luteolibacter sp.]|nr:CmpA/NrtA family ABC transporter substrate-binding protein [Luteolibacter sp.]